MSMLSCTRKMHARYWDVLEAPSSALKEEYLHAYQMALWDLRMLVGSRAAENISTHIKSDVWEKWQRQSHDAISQRIERLEAHYIKHVQAYHTALAALEEQHRKMVATRRTINNMVKRLL